ncbi:hypothetical protein A5707_09145 [Mycobacterium kyorinense]|uniref:Uncharacterized protein n=1 Tax=Mycobacterium kyorinense TaxID=487514 RepID=A0A1A2YTJ9_9MYCO|nr:hypothetical protein [Mycobacterium kyorinense]OBI40572.1 hypothetical protein A5707_09145 [Mycobacterium kyorinense]
MATTDTPTTAQSLLALYGALDQAVTETGDAHTEAIVERYLPGTTGKNAGWYDELLGFQSSLVPRTVEAPPTPDLSQALTVLQGRAEPTAMPEAELQPGVQYARGAEARPEPLTAVQKSRMLYAIGALSHLPQKYPPSEYDPLFARALESIGTPGGDLLDLLRSEFNSPDDWPHVMYLGEQRGLIGSVVAAVPLCQRKFKWVHGYPCVVLTTDFARTDVSLDDLKAVIDPLNWDKCLPFFCLMTGEVKRNDGWSRVLEHVSTICHVPGAQMVTPLKYWKGEQLPQPSAWVDYELDDDPAPGEKGDGWMVVDEGFIRMTSTVGNSAQDGVRVRTRKVAGFRNLGWAPAAMYACVMGYGNQGLEMLIDGVAKRKADGGVGWTPWEASIAPAGPGATPGSDKPRQPADDTDPAQRAVALAVELVNKCIDDMSATSAALASKWASGAMPIAETMTYTTDLAARLATDPWRYLERLRGADTGPAHKDDK